MNPEERVLLERSLKLAEENNHILRKMQRTARWAVLWGFIKIAIIVVPLTVGYIYFLPFLDQALENFNSIKELLNISTPR